MKKMAGMIVGALVFALVLVPVVVSAATLFQRQAGMRMFSGRIENIDSATTDEAHLVLAVGTHNMGSIVEGNEGDITSADNMFPVLIDAYHERDNAWHDSTGKAALSAPIFSLFCEDGDITNVAMRIEVSGDLSATAALRFGVCIVHYAADRETMLRTDTASYEVAPNGMSETIAIGDMLEGETVEIYIATWVMASDFASCEYAGGEISVEAVFFSEAETV